MTLAVMLLAASVSSAHQPAAIIAQLFAAFNRHDVAALQALYAPDAVLTSTDFCKARSGADVSRTYGAMFQAFPDIRDDVLSIVIDGDQAVVRFESSGGAPQNKFDSN